MDKIILEVGVKAFIKNNQGKYLFLKRSKPYQNQKFCKWGVPGGRINPGKEILRSLRREIKEETNLVMDDVEKILAVQDILIVKGKHTVRVTFLVRCKSGNIILDSKEYKDYKWLTTNELSKLRNEKYLAPVVKKLN